MGQAQSKEVRQRLSDVLGWLMFYSTVMEQTHTEKEGQRKRKWEQVTEWWRGRKKSRIVLTFFSDHMNSDSFEYVTLSLKITSKQWNNLNKNIPNADIIIHA